jgi:hypothetical protein
VSSSLRGATLTAPAIRPCAWAQGSDPTRDGPGMPISAGRHSWRLITAIGEFLTTLCVKFFTESLILAQDERWRRA